jgi:cytoskeleton-associated protein 2
LASKGAFDVIGLYEGAIKSGAAPVQELWKIVLYIVQDPNGNREGTTPDSLGAGTNILTVEELAMKIECGKAYLFPEERAQVTATPQVTKAEQDNHPGIKLQIASIPR